MSLRLGIVVDTHPEDNAVDIFMAGNGERLIGVKVVTSSGSSSRTGGIDLPEITARSDKWDVTEDDEQEVRAVVGYIGNAPVVVGFVYPPKNQIVTTDKKTLYRRHQSDVQWSIDGDANAQLLHPSGAYIRIGEDPDAAEVEAAQSSSIDRNTGKRVNVRIGLAGNAVVVTLTPDGDMQVTLKRDMTVTADGDISMATKKTFNIQADGNVSVSTGGNARVEAIGNVAVSADGNASVDAAGNVDLTAGGNATIGCATAIVNAPSGVSMNTPLVKVSGMVLAKDFLKG